MKYYLMLGLLIISSVSHAQKTIETWYDENWEETHVQLARYYSHRENTDSGWYRKDMFVSTQKWQMVGLYEDKECNIKNGIFRFYYPDGNLKSLGMLYCFRMGSIILNQRLLRFKNKID